MSSPENANRRFESPRPLSQEFYNQLSTSRLIRDAAYQILEHTHRLYKDERGRNLVSVFWRRGEIEKLENWLVLQGAVPHTEDFRPRDQQNPVEAAIHVAGWLLFLLEDGLVATTEAYGRWEEEGNSDPRYYQVLAASEPQLEKILQDHTMLYTQIYAYFDFHDEDLR